MRRYISGWSALTVCLCALTVSGARPAHAAADSAAPFRPEDLVVLRRISDPQV